MNDQLTNYYNGFTHNYGVNSTRKKKILELVGDDFKNKTILDIGCVKGDLGEYFMKEATVYGVDISDVAVVEAKKRLTDAFVMNVELDTWPEALLYSKPDIIICGEVIEHLFDQDAFLEKLKQVIKPDTIIIFTTPNFLLWSSRIRMLFGRYGDREVLFDKSHIHLMSLNGFKKLLIKHNYKIIQDNHIYHPNWLIKFKKYIPDNLCAFQSIFKVKL